jgi:hypothetical protein
MHNILEYPFVRLQVHNSIAQRVSSMADNDWYREEGIQKKKQFFLHRLAFSGVRLEIAGPLVTSWKSGAATLLVGGGAAICLNICPEIAGVPPVLWISGGAALLLGAAICSVICPEIACALLILAFSSPRSETVEVRCLQRLDSRGSIYTPSFFLKIFLRCMKKTTIF